MIRPVFTVFVLLAFISLANAQVGLRFSAVQSNLQKYENATQESIYGLGFGVFGESTLTMSGLVNQSFLFKGLEAP
jgi:hypothetical protein